MNPKTRIEQMLRKRQEAQTLQSSQPQVTVEGLTHASSLDRIQQMLRQRARDATSEPVKEVKVEVKASDDPSCPYCTGALLSQDGLLQCNTCRKRFTFRVTDGEIVDVERLLYGVCRCCLLRRPIVRNGEFTVCSLSNERYIEYKGEYLRLLGLPFGLCSCCDNPRPLTVDSESRIICTDTGAEYVRNLDGTTVRKPPVVDISSPTSSIEAALNDGTAQFYYGGFIGTKRH